MPTLKDLQKELRDLGYKTSFRRKQQAQDLVDSLRWYNTFPWHEDQRTVLSWSDDIISNTQQYQQSVIQGVFGSGKVSLI